MKPILKPLKFVGSSQDDIRDFPEAVRRAIGTELMVVQFGGTPTDFKPMSAVGAGAYEVRVRYFRCVASHLCRQVRRRGLRFACVSEKDAENQQRRYRPRDLAAARYKLIAGKP